MKTTRNGKYIIEGWKEFDDNGDCFALVQNVGWCKYSNKLAAILIPGKGWYTY